MQVVWEADTAAFASRKRAARACIPCQKKKKRCSHTFTRPPDQAAETDGLDRVLPNLTHKEPIRFVGDLNPESILTDLSARSKGATRVSRIGTWVEQSRQPQDENSLRPEELVPPKSGEKTPINVEKYGKVEGGRRTLTAHYRNYLQAVGAFRVLPKATQDALVTTYIACIDGILPIVDGGKLLRDYANGHASIFLIQAICLVTCKAPEVGQYLRLYEDGPLLDPIPFARSLHTGLDAAMKADLEPDRVTKIQILTLMHLHNDGPGGIEDSSQHLSQAIHDAWTAALHIHTPGRTLKDSSSLTWWTLWTLDRINACIGGRPMMIADRDIDIDRPPLEDYQRIANIHVWIRLGDLLDEVIEFYRPTVDPDSTGWEKEFPTWGSILEGIDTEGFHESHLGIHELCYNVIAILSCRAGGPGTNSYARRITAADRIQSLLADSRHLQCPPLPLVPYAISLSLTVAYRGLRDHYSDPEVVQQNMEARCVMLESLSNYWWTADAMAKLGRKALKSMQQPGVRRAEVVDLANAMDAEVTACKFGPFEGKDKVLDEAGGSVTSPHRSDRNVDAGSKDGKTKLKRRGNALDLLSDAAAAHATTNISNNNSTKHRKTDSATNLAAFTGNLSISPSQSHLNATPNTTAPLPTTTTLSSLHRTATSPLSFTHTNHTDPTTTSTPIATPGPPPLLDSSSSHSLAPHQSYTPGPLDASVFDTYHFDDLDNLFDGFFNLSMPTIFQDPLFEGGAFLDDTDVDMTMSNNNLPGGGGGMSWTGASEMPPLLPPLMSPSPPVDNLSATTTVNTMKNMDGSNGKQTVAGNQTQRQRQQQPLQLHRGTLTEYPDLL